MILNKTVVDWCVQKRCDAIEAAKKAQLKGLKNPGKKAWVSRLYNDRIRAELEVYATVRIEEFRDGFRLCYAGDHSGTGPFATEAEAALWFLNEGR